MKGDDLRGNLQTCYHRIHQMISSHHWARIEDIRRQAQQGLESTHKVRMFLVAEKQKYFLVLPVMNVTRNPYLRTIQPEIVNGQMK